MDGASGRDCCDRRHGWGVIKLGSFRVLLLELSRGKLEHTIGFVLLRGRLHQYPISSRESAWPEF